MLLSDHEIRGLCVRSKWTGTALAPLPEERVFFYHGWPSVTHEAMIEPFAEAVSGDNVISYGLTSAGYDLRLGPELLHFPEKCLNVCSLCRERGTCDKIADPKKFKEPGYRERFFRREVLKEGQAVFIPPHQYVLGHSYEYLRIPRFLKARCTGKSTLARCFTGDTKISLLDGTEESLVSMVDNPNKRRWGFGVRPDSGQYIATELILPRWVGRESVLLVTLDDGSEIRCTPDHEFLRHGGWYTEAASLKPGDGLVPLYTRRFRGRKQVWAPRARFWVPAYWLADLWNLEHGIYEEGSGDHRHHQDRDQRNDNPTNIVRMNGRDHIRMHNADYYGEGFDAESFGRAVMGGYAAKMLDPEWMAAYSESQRAKAEGFWNDPKYAEARAARNKAIRESWNTEGKRESWGEEVRKRWENAEYKERLRESYRRSWTPERRASHAEKMRKYHSRRSGGNHTVTSVRMLRGKRDVFCVTSADTGNFALSTGAIVKNCGIMINTTPLEPEWEGHLTIEIGNITDCPAQVYVGEGIAQLEFEVLSSDPQTSYRDKGGKYQGQRGVTPAIVK